jgi:cell division protein ZapA
MAQLTLQINGKPYSCGCEDGQELHLQSLGALVDAKVSEVAASGGGLGDTRLMLMGALILADEVTSVQARLAAAEADLERVRNELKRADNRAVAALEAAAQKIETMASK